MTQDWSAFAPDFETLLDNREHIESETEFDVEQVTEGEKDDSQGKKEIAMEEGDMMTNEDAVVDIESLEGNGIYSGEGIRYHGYRFDHLPVILPTDPVSESDEEEQEGAGNGEKQDELMEEKDEVKNEGAPEAMDGDSHEKDQADVENGGDGMEENAAKKARID